MIASSARQRNPLTIIKAHDNKTGFKGCFNDEDHKINVFVQHIDSVVSVCKVRCRRILNIRREV